MTPEQDNTIKEVIEAHRKKIGATEINVTLEPGATPEGLKDALDLHETKIAAYRSFTELEKEQAKTTNLRNSMREIMSDLSEIRKYPECGIDAENRELFEKLSAMSCKLELAIVTDISVDTDMARMIEERDKHGLALPDEVVKFLAVPKKSDDVESDVSSPSV